MNRFVSRTALALVLGSGLLGAAQAAEYTQVDAAASRIAFTYKPVSYTHLTLPTTPYV